MPDDRAIDGQDMMPIITGKTEERSKAIPFRARGNATIVKDRYKLVLPKAELYDLSRDWGEASNIASEHPARVQRMTDELMDHLQSMRKSHAGNDYDDPSFKPLNNWDAFRTRRKQ